MGYCQITDVVSEFPRFVRNAPNSISDAQIQAWIDQGAARIRAALMQRGIDPSTITLSTDQTNWLSSLNEDWAASKLAAVLEANISLQPGEVSVAQQRRRSFESVLGDIKLGRYDAFWSIQSRLANSIAGAEADRTTPHERGENRSFGKNQAY